MGLFDKQLKALKELELPINYNTAHWTIRRAAKLQYIKEQDNKCVFCSISLSEEPLKDKEITEELYPENFFDYPIHLHHNHETGMTIGVVHAYCNAVLWEHYGE